MSWEGFPISYDHPTLLRVWEWKWRYRYKLERQASEWIDLGGEG